MIIGWILLSILLGVFAGNKGRSGIGFFFLSLFLSPLLAFLILLVTKGELDATCPACKESVRSDALKCKHCGEPLGASRNTGDKVTRNTDDRVKCPNPKCIFKVSKDAKVCPYCGESMLAVTQTNPAKSDAASFQICAKCEGGTPTGSKFCQHCGAPQ